MVKTNPDTLFLFSENARPKIKEYANLLKKSPQRLKYTLKTLEKEQLIHNPHCVFDYSYFGLILFRVYFKGGYIGERDKAEIINKLKENKYIVSMYELSGEFDLVIEMESPNPSRFNKELKKVATLIPLLNHYKVILNVVTHIYPKHYLPKNPLLVNLDSEIIIGGDRSVESFSANELMVMKNLLMNPKQKITTLAKNSNLNPKTANSVLNNLKKRKIIRGFKNVMDTNQIGIERVRLILQLHNLTQERETEFMNFMLSTKEIVQVNKTVGDWDMEIDIESLSRTKLRHLIIKIREDFKDLIENFNIIEFYKYYKKSYLPGYLFEEK